MSSVSGCIRYFYRNGMTQYSIWLVVHLLVLGLGWCPAVSVSAAVNPMCGVMSNTLSRQAKADLLPVFYAALHRPKGQIPKNTAEWDALAKFFEQSQTAHQEAMARSFGVTFKEDMLGGVPVLRIYPKNYKSSTRLLVYVHGGGYVVQSAHSTVGISSLLARESGLQVVAIDYTLAPHGTYQTATDQVISVWNALIKLGRQPESMGMFGDSAGGGLAAGSILKMRDQRIPIPGALFVGSPWADLSDVGDSYLTLKYFDPVLKVGILNAAADIYAHDAKKNPYASPVYGDFNKPFPPTLIQGGTRELFLSDSVRLYQAIRQGGHEAILDLYEGMPHIFYTYTYTSKEGKTALSRQAKFFDNHLK
ncbi:alpha/beta hydrolase [Celerinatantimonas sp. YJH-8]|uniref:alpha/beta hydrolase n=1 Tax=Celerinatantimonas sp. YJH-8 TaxID=3228714 RepID=UPI0038C74CB4